VGLIIQPVFATYLMSSEHYKRFCYLQLLISPTSAIFCGVSLLTMTAISVDRLLALMLGLRFRQVVTLRRFWVLVVSFWFYHASISPTLFFNADILIKLISVEVLLCVIISTCCYSKIYFILRQLNITLKYMCKTMSTEDN